MATEQDYWNQMYANACDQNEVLSLRQKLAHRDAQIVMLRDVVSHVGGMRFSIVTTKMCEAALAATELKT